MCFGPSLRDSDSIDIVALGARESYLAATTIGPPSMVTKAADFNEWYNEVVDRSGLRDKRYPVKGMDVWTPYGWAAMTRVDNLLPQSSEPVP